MRWRSKKRNATADEEAQTRQTISVVRRNIRALVEARHEAERRMTNEERVAARITDFAGSMRFVYLHAVLYGGWLLLNLGVFPRIRPWDPFPFVMLAMIASVEAIFLSTFVLINQNHMSALSERRADLDLHFGLLAEHEVTRMLELVDAIARRLGVLDGSDPETEELKQDVPPEEVLRELEHAEAQLREESDLHASDDEERETAAPRR